MVKSLSSANQTNIAATHLEYDVLVEMPNLSSPKKWSSGTRSGYETRLMNISEIRQSVDPSGGVASLSDFTVTIQQETPTQFIQEQDVGNTVVEVYIQFGSDAKIPVIKGRLDRWELQGGLTRLFCIADLGLRDKHIPLDRINTDTSILSGFAIPARNQQRWVPLTIGSVDPARGYLVDTTIPMKVLFNSEVSGHEAIGEFTDGTAWVDSLGKHLEILSDTSRSSGEEWFEIGTSGGDITEAGYVEMRWTPIPAGATQDGGGSDPENATDDNFSTFALFQDIASGGTPNSPVNATAHLRVKIPEASVPSTWWVDKNESGSGVYAGTLAFLADLDRGSGTNEDLNDTDKTGERLQAAIEVNPGTFPTDSSLIEDVLTDGESHFDNLNNNTDGKTDVTFSTSSYDDKIGEDTTDSGTADSLRVEDVLGRNLALEYEESDIGGTDELKIQEMRLRFDFRAEASRQEYTADLAGYDDDGSGTYTGSANALIENPADVIHFLLDQYLGLSGMNTSQFATARDNMGGLSMAGQVLKRQGAQKVLEKIGKEFKLKIFTDFNDDWAASAIQPPTSADKTLRQTSGDFTTGSSEPGAFEGEIKRVTQSPLEELYNQFTIRYDYDRTAETYASEMTLDETTTSSGLGHPSGDAIGAWLTESQSRYNVTRELVVELDWVRGFNNALALAQRLIYFHADRKRIAEFQTSVNTADLEIGDTVEMAHDDLARAADSTIHAGYETDASGTTVQAGFTDPDTSAVIKAGADVEIFGARHIFEIFEVRADLLNNSEPTGLLNYKARQAGIDRAPLVSPV